MASKRFPALKLGNSPHEDVISASASQPLAEEFGGNVRDCIRSNEYQQLFPGVDLKMDTTAKGRWATNDGGSYYAVGIGGQLYGKGAELGLIDDPFGSWEDAQSEIQRKRVYDWYTGTFYNRIRPGGAIVVIQHRMHEDDLVGCLIRAERDGGDRWKVISFPADMDNPPWPERYDAHALERIKAAITKLGGLRKWNSLYMQDPAPEEGTYFEAAWMRRYTDTPKALNIYVTGDFAVSDEMGDYTELGVWGVDDKDNIYCLDWWTGRKTADVWIERLLDFVARYQPIHFVGEMGPIRKAIEPFLERRMRERSDFALPVWLPVNGDKPAMARSFQALCSMGRVYFPYTDWAERVIDQLLRFPGGRFDDCVDACSLLGRHIHKTWEARAKEEPKEINWDAPPSIGAFKPKHWPSIDREVA